MGAGLLCTGSSLVVAGFVQLAVNKAKISVFWIIPQFFLVSCGEILLSVTVYEFAYTQAPKSMKGLLTALWLLTVALVWIEYIYLHIFFLGKCNCSFN